MIGSFERGIWLVSGEEVDRFLGMDRSWDRLCEGEFDRDLAGDGPVFRGDLTGLDGKLTGFYLIDWSWIGSDRFTALGLRGSLQAGCRQLEQGFWGGRFPALRAEANICIYIYIYIHVFGTRLDQFAFATQDGVFTSLIKERLLRSDFFDVLFFSPGRAYCFGPGQELEAKYEQVEALLKQAQPANRKDTE